MTLVQTAVLLIIAVAVALVVRAAGKRLPQTNGGGADAGFTGGGGTTAVRRTGVMKAVVTVEALRAFPTCLHGTMDQWVSPALSTP